MTTIDSDLDSLRWEARDFSRWIRIGAVAIAAFTVTFGVWAVAAPIAGAAIAPGKVVSDGRSQALRHASGGVLVELLVREGQHVAAGEVIAVLDNTSQQAAHSQLLTRLARLDLLTARLTVEQAGKPFVLTLDAASADYPAFAPHILAPLLADQMREHQSAISAHEAERDVLARQRAAIVADRNGLGSEIAALRQQQESLERDLELRRLALADGYGRAAELRQMEREYARIVGSVGRADGQLNVLTEQMAEVERRIAAMDAARNREINEALGEARSERLELSDKLAEAAAAVARVEIRADAAGIIDILHVNTIGSAIEPYAVIAEIVPADAPLLIEAEVQPAEIDAIELGQTAEVMFEGQSRQNLDPLVGEVVYVSPDTHVDERTKLSHYTVRLSIPRTALAELPPTLPGMPVQAYFLKRDHTLIEYLVDPLVSSFSKAFR